MQERDAQLYKNIAKVLREQRKARNLKFTIFCYENDIATSLLNTIENGSAQTYYSNIARVIKALGLTYEEFGRLLDKEEKLNQNILLDDI